MKIHYLPYLVDRARNLRRDMTDAERKLWQRIRQRQIARVQFFRQRPIGQYIVDFYCPTRRLVIEVDGAQHFEEKEQQYDHARDAYLATLGIKVIRFDNREMLTNIDGVLARIEEFLL